MKTIKIYSVTFGLIMSFCDFLHAQDFNIPFNHRGRSDHVVIRHLSDSSFVSLTAVNYYNYLISDFDTFNMFLVRYSKLGEIMYYQNIKTVPDLLYYPLDMVISNNKIFIGGRIDYPDTLVIFGFMMRLNQCFEVEKNIIYKYKTLNSQGIEKLENFSDTEVLAICQHSIQTDTIYSTVILFDHDLNIKWHSTYFGESADICVMDNYIHLWGDGYYPRQDIPSISERKFNHVILDKKGKIISQKIKDRYIDGSNSAGGRIIKASNNQFLIASYTDIKSKYTNELMKLTPSGNVIKRVMLNNPKDEEFVGGLSRINDNRYLAIGSQQLDFDTSICYAYLVDSNLNIIRKKRILPNISWAGLFRAIPYGFSDGALLFGYHFNAGSGIFAKGLILKLDTFLNIAKKPLLNGYFDSLCLAPVSGIDMNIPTPDTVMLETLNLRKNIYVSVQPITKDNIHVFIYPNPSIGILEIIISEPNGINSIEIYNSIGTLIYKQTNLSEKTTVDLSKDNSGLYFVKVMNNGKIITTQKIIKQ